MNNRTGKLGVTINAPLTEAIKARCYLMLGNALDDGRDYHINFRFIKALQDAGEWHQWRCRALVYLVNWADAQVDEWCIAPDDKGAFEHSSRAYREDGETYEMDVYTTLDGRVFEGGKYWQRVK